jgi:hypothetical protein
MRRRAAGHEPHCFEMDRLGEFLRKAQMAKVDRVESTAENSDRSGHESALPHDRGEKIFNRKGRKGRKGKNLHSS